MTSSTSSEITQEPETIGTILQSAEQSTLATKQQATGNRSDEKVITSPCGKFSVPYAPDGLADRIRNRDEEAERIRRECLWNNVVADIGPRHSVCWVSNFRQHGTPDEQSRQAKVLKRVEQYAQELPNQKSLQNAVFFGPCGSGKDRLMVSLLFEATTLAGRKCKWIDGLNMFGELRDNIGKQKPEGDFLRELVEPDVLAVSDLIPPFGALSDFQAGFLFRVIDSRYRMMRATMITANFKDANDANRRCGPQITDRLRDGAVALDCFWQSYRGSEN